MLVCDSDIILSIYIVTTICFCTDFLNLWFKIKQTSLILVIKKCMYTLIGTNYEYLILII